MTITIREAREQDVPLILSFIRGIAEYERLAHEVVATEAQLAATLFGLRPAAEVLLAYLDQEPAGFAMFFPTYSSFLAREGIHLEDVFVWPHLRGKGVGKALLARVAKITVERQCGRLEWSVLDWNEPAIGFYNGLQARPMNEWTVFRLTGDALERLAGQNGSR